MDTSHGKLLEDRFFPRSNVLLGEVAHAELDERQHAQLVRIVQFSSQTERRHGDELESGRSVC